MRPLSPEALDRLAAEYVLGTLRGRARQRFAAIAAADPCGRDAVARWQAGLTPLAERLPPVAPPARVWRSIEARIAPPVREPARAGAVWRAFGMAAAGLAAVLLAFFVRLEAPAPEPQWVAVLTSPDAAARMVATLEAPGRLRVRTVKPWGGIEGRSLELWALPAEGAPRSLGLVANAGETTLALAPGDARLLGAHALAVSLEPAGGSPTKAPTGPVLCSGAIAPVRKT